MKRFGFFLAIWGSAAVLVGCSVSSSSETTAARSDLVSNAKHFISHELPDLPPAKSVDCPGDVESKAGKTFECQATLANGQTLTIPFRIRSTNDQGGRLGPNPDVIDPALAVDVVYKNANSVKSVDCPTDIPAKVGRTFVCTVSFTDGNNGTATLKVRRATPQGAQFLLLIGHQG